MSKGTNYAGGYAEDFSRSNRAVKAEANGGYPASVAAKLLKVEAEAVRKVVGGGDEWHHTGLYYIRTEYYDISEELEALENPARFALEVLDEDNPLYRLELMRDMSKEIRAARRNRKTENLGAGRVRWLVWVGKSRRYMRALDRAKDFTRCEKKGKTYKFYDSNGVHFLTKREETNGFRFFLEGDYILKTNK